jgi:hypothetical protein
MSDWTLGTEQSQSSKLILMCMTSKSDQQVDLEY